MSGIRTIANRFIIADPEHDLLGRGGMGDVYRATDALTGDTVAVKALDPSVLAREPDLLERFRREGEALRQLNHPNIVHMLAACEEGGRHYLVMEYVGAGSLQDLLHKEGRLSQARAVEIALDLADALTRAHRLGIIHRDLKPANILMAPDGTPRLADFGIAHVPIGPRLTQTGAVIGTIHYLSPEACRGEVLDERSDIWAFGVLLFEMLSGRVPFAGPDVMAVLTAILTQPVPDLSQVIPGLPDALVDLVYRMLEKDRHQRIPSVRLVGAELEPLLSRGDGDRPAGASPSRFAPRTPGLHGLKSNLPAQATAFVGREHELIEMARLLAEPGTRLVTLVGLGGMGKTRLALEAAARQLDQFRNGVFFVPLAPVSSTDAVVPTVAQAVGFTFYEGGDPEQQLLGYFREKQLLLVLDNCEHLLDALGLIGQVLAAAPGVKVLATSRVRLGVQGEQLFQLGGMEVPECATCAEALAYAAVKLFVQSARRVRPAFELTENVLAHVIRICRLSQGMPLAIILAAAWVELLDPAEIAAEISANVDFLSTDLRNVDERQRSIRSVFDYSWNMLSAHEREVLQTLSVFRGGFTREAGQAVADASLRDLMALTGKSLVYRRPEGRYEIHELLRQYAAEKLSASPEIEHGARERHSAFYVDMLQARREAMRGYDQARVLAELTVEIDNLRATWDWAVAEGSVAELERCWEELGWVYELKDWHREGEELFARAAASISTSSDGGPSSRRLLCGRLRLRHGYFLLTLGKQSTLAGLAQQCLDLFQELGAEREAAYARCLFMGVHTLSSKSREAQYRQAERAFRSLGERYGLGLAQRWMAGVLIARGDYVAARFAWAESLEQSRQIEDMAGTLDSLDGLAFTCWLLGEYQYAHKLYEELLALASRTGSRSWVAEASFGLGLVALGVGRLNEARESFIRSLAIFRDIGKAGDILGDLAWLAVLSNLSGQYEEALRYGEQAMLMEGQLGWSNESLACLHVGVAHSALGNYAASRRYLRLALVDARTRQGPLLQLWGLYGAARLEACKGKEEDALELLALVTSFLTSSQLLKDLAASAMAELDGRLAPDVVNAAIAAGRSRDLDATVAELIEELDAGQ